MAASSHNVVIVGAGFGGNGVVNGLTKTGSLPDGLSVTMLDRKKSLSIGATWQFHWSSRIDNILQFKMDNLKAKSHVNLVTGDTEATVNSIDTDKKELALANGKSISYDTLVLSPGVVSDASVLDGLAESAALDICNIAHVPIIKQRLDETLREAAAAPKTIMMCVTRMPYKCPPVPFEVASIVDDLRRERGVKENVKVIISAPVEFPFAGPPAKKLFVRLLGEQDIEYWPNHEVARIEQAGSQQVVHFKVGEERKITEVDLLLCTFPQRAPDFCKPLCNPKGYIDVDLQTNAVKSFENMYAIGDSCQAIFPAPKKPHPKAGEFAYMMGLHVADQIIASCAGDDQPAPPSRKASCVAECGVGGKGVNIQPNFTDVLANPESGLPKFQFPIVETASLDKIEWVNGYLAKFFCEGNFTPMAM